MRKPAAMAVLACAMMLAAAPAQAQLMYYEDGQSGLSAAGGVSDGVDSWSYRAGFVFTAGGRLDLGLAFEQAQLDDEVIGPDGSSIGFIPSMTFGLVRPSPRLNLGVEFSVALKTGDYSSDYLKQAKQDLTSQALTGLLSFHTRKTFSPSLALYPELYVGYLDADMKLDDRSSYLVESDISELVLGGGLHVRLNDKVRISATYTSIDGDDTWGLTAGYLAPQSADPER